MVACKEEVVKAPQSTLGFESDVHVYTEADGFVLIPVILNEPQFGFVKAEFEFNYPDTGTHTSDDVVVFNNPVMIYGGDNLGGIKVSIVDDRVKDKNDTIELTLTSITGNAELDPDLNKQKTTIVIVDDDDIPENEMRLHIKWYGTQFNWRPEVNYDLSLSLVTNVVMGEAGIVSSNVYRSSNRINKFEDIIITESDTDQDYYIVISYDQKFPGALSNEVQGTLKLSGFGYRDYEGNLWSFKLPDTGYYSYIGPFKKSGRTFVLQE